MKRITLEEEMKKNPQLKLSDIQSLREWCEKQPHLPKIEDSFLALFLHSNYYQMEPTKNTIETYYTARTHLPEFFCNRDPLEEKKLRQAFKVTDIDILIIIEINCDLKRAILPLNGITKDGYKIIYGTYLDPDPSNYIFNDNAKYSTMLHDIYFLTDGTNNGYTYIVDASKLSFGHVARMSPLGLKKMLYYIQKAAPIRLKGIHVINAPPAMELLMNTAKPFMKKELMDIIHFHSSFKSLSEYIPVDALPNEMGGKAGSVHELAEIQVKKLEDYREWFLLDESTRSDFAISCMSEISICDVAQERAKTEGD
ncbi:alpha-tocopherol transfer protein-like isoform X2 [Temnothorax nylanderi]|uniref:alpha-tocopherol transfer protein-like isoform X2 n=1 Tax=Temnothorax nylanderi TaxID=102681 RepID=UPI003A88EC4D